MSPKFGFLHIFNGFKLIHPVEDIANDGPAGFLGFGPLTEDPVVIQSIDGFVFLFQVHPVIHKIEHGLITAGDRITGWYFLDIRFGDDDLIIRV